MDLRTGEIREHRLDDYVTKITAVAPEGDCPLWRSFRRELDIGMTEANVRVAKSLFEMATRDKVPSAAIFWMKARAGWREQQDLNIGGNGQPVTYEFCWRDEPGTAPAPPTIEAEPTTTSADAPLVVWEGSDGC